VARLPRFPAPGIPQHVIQRGNNRSATFAAVSDYLFYRDCLEAAYERYQCRIGAIPPDLLPLHRAESRTSRDCDRSPRLSVVELQGKRSRHS